MDNDVAAPQQPVQDEPQAPAEPVETPEPQEPAEASEPTQELSQEVNEGAEAPEPEEEETLPEDPEFDPLAYSNLANQGQYEFKPAEDGSVDPYQVAQQIENRLLNTMRFQQSEAKAWDKIDKKYGDKLTPTRRELIFNARVANAINGKETNLTKLADKVMQEFTTAKSEGRAEAGISRKVQKSASLETATSNTGPDRSNEERYDRIMSGDNNATDDLLKDWLAAGKI